jgi:hypothetical protein
MHEPFVCAMNGCRAQDPVIVAQWRAAPSLASRSSRLDHHFNPRLQWLTSKKR